MMRGFTTPAVMTAIGVLIASAAIHSAARQSAQPATAPRARALAEIVSAPITIRDGIGTVHDAVTTASNEGGAFYRQGVAYLHSFVWIEAARSFNQALRHDPNLAMAYVRLSYALGELGLSREARDATERAQRLASSVSLRERAQIELRVAQLAAAALPTDAALRTAYRRKLDEVATNHPDDVELLLLVGQAQDPSHDAHGMNAGSASLPFYLRALEQSPDYFAAHHFLTHAYENTSQFDRAIVHAEQYARLAGAVPHAHHMHGHVLRRLNRMNAAIAEFEKADQIESAYLKSETIPPQYDWHYRHNLSLLGTSYQYAGRMTSADSVLRRSSQLDGVTSATLETSRKPWVMLLLARGQPAEALAAVRPLITQPLPVVRALGHLLSAQALLALKRTDDAVREGNSALGEMRAAGPAGGVLVPEYELIQGEFLLRSGQRESARATLQAAAAKLHDSSGPDAWVTTLFSLEAVVRTAKELGDWTLVESFTEHMDRLDPNYPGTHYARGLLAERGGDREAATVRYQEAMRGWSGADADFAPRREARERVAALRTATPSPRR